MPNATSDARVYKLCIFIVFGLLLLKVENTFATIFYFNDETSSTMLWITYDDNPAEMSIINISEIDQISQNIKHECSDINNDDLIKSHNQRLNSEPKSVFFMSWYMNFSQLNRISFLVNTTMGRRRLEYISTELNNSQVSDNVIQHSIGYETQLGSRVMIIRDLVADLVSAEPDNILLSVNCILVNGKGMIANMKFVKDTRDLKISNSSVNEMDSVTNESESGASKIPANISDIENEANLVGSETTHKQPKRTQETTNNFVPGRARTLLLPTVERVVDSNSISATKSSAPAINVDGKLGDRLWNQATVSGGFWSSLNNTKPLDRTEILVTRDNKYLYFGYRMYDSQPLKIKATNAVRDAGLGYDDSITLELDTFFNRRDISKFSMNLLGTQNDDIAGGRSGKIEWKGDWAGAASRTSYGWSAEMAIPFEILNFKTSSSLFGINFKRYQNRTNQYSWWSDITPKLLPENMGQLRGLNMSYPTASESRYWTFMPFVLAGKNIPDEQDINQDELLTAGIDIRYQPRSDLTAVVSVNPDFSQIEKAVAGISFSYSEIAVDDNRPFFLEGSDYFPDQVNNDDYFYSNRVPDFDFAGKLFGRVGNTSVGLLATSADEGRLDFVGRVSYELNATDTLTTALITTDQSEIENAVALVHFDGRNARNVNYSFDWAISGTQIRSGIGLTEDTGNLYKAKLGWNSDYWYLKSKIDKYDANYIAALALVDEERPGTQSASLTSGYYKEGTDSFWRVVDTYAGIDYRETDGNLLQNRNWFTGFSVEFKKEIRTALTLQKGPHRKVSEIPGVFEDKLNQDQYYSTLVDFNTRNDLFSYGLQYDWGQLGGGVYEYLSGYALLKPISDVVLKLSAEQTDSFGLSQQVVLVGSWKINTENSIGARYLSSEFNGNGNRSYRITYARKARKGVDIFVVHNFDTNNNGNYSVKLVYAY